MQFAHSSADLYCYKTYPSYSWFFKEIVNFASPFRVCIVHKVRQLQTAMFI